MAARAVLAGRGRCATVVLVTAADSNVAASATPVPSGERIAALDVLRGLALLGIFIMNMPGFSHSPFAAPVPEASAAERLVAALRETLFAGKFNLLFGLLFGIGFALQMARLRRGAAKPSDAIRVYARRLVFLLAIGIVHAMLLWPGDVLVVYAVLGFALLALERLSDRGLLVLIAACLLFPALAELARTALFSIATGTVAAFEYQQLAASNDLAFGHGSFLDAVAETARVFAWSYASPLGLLAYAAYYVQMATGILAGFIIGRRGWHGGRPPGASALARAQRSALALVVGAIVVAVAASTMRAELPGPGPTAALFVATFAQTIERAALATFYALTVLRVVGGRGVPRWLRPFECAGRMPLSNYLLQTVLASFVFYGWGLGLWGRAGPAAETLLALALFVFVQLPLSLWWLGRFRSGPLEYLWRRFTYGPAAA
jgi:uncharacterized protein